MDRRFSFYLRGKIFYVQFYNPKLKKYSSGRSTGQTRKNAAQLVVAKWLETGIPEPGSTKKRPIQGVLAVDSLIDSIRRSELTYRDAERIVSVLEAKDLLDAGEDFLSFLDQFWNYEKSQYVRDKLAHGHSIGRRHCYDMNLHCQNYWKPWFKNKKLIEVKKTDLQEFSFSLSDKGLSAKSINNILSAGFTAL